MRITFLSICVSESASGRCRKGCNLSCTIYIRISDKVGSHECNNFLSYDPNNTYSTPACDWVHVDEVLQEGGRVLLLD